MTHDAPAVRALGEAGYEPNRLAALAGLRGNEVTAELVGRRALSDRTMAALRGLLGPHLAEEIAAQAGASRAAYLMEVQAGRM